MTLPDREPNGHPATADVICDGSLPADTSRSNRAAPVAVLIFADLALVAVNAEWTAMTGLTAALSKGVGWLTAMHPADRPSVVSFFAAATGYNRDFRIVTAGRSDRWIRADINELDGRARLIQVVTMTVLANRARRSRDPTGGHRLLRLIAPPAIQR